MAFGIIEFRCNITIEVGIAFGSAVGLRRRSSDVNYLPIPFCTLIVATSIVKGNYEL